MLGANGAGKTTLLRVLATLLRPHEGDVAVLGAELPRERWKVRGKVGYLGHEPLLYRELTGARTWPTRRACTASTAAGSTRCSAAVGLERAPTSRCATSRAGWCSGSPPRARCCTTRRCCCSTSRAPELDPAAAELLEPLIGRPSGRTRVLVSHDVEWALAEADLALGLRGGRQEFARPAAEVDARAARELSGDPGPPRRSCARTSRIELRTLRGGAGDDALHRHRVRALPLRARPRHARRRPGERRAVGDAAARDRDRRDAAVRGRARPGRDRRRCCSRRSTARRCSSRRRPRCCSTCSRSSWSRCPAFAILLLGPDLLDAMPELLAGRAAGGRRPRRRRRARGRRSRPRAGPASWSCR